jgi:hypothetical protein
VSPLVIFHSLSVLALHARPRRPCSLLILDGGLRRSIQFRVYEGDTALTGFHFTALSLIKAPGDRENMLRGQEFYVPQIISKHKWKVFK